MHNTRDVIYPYTLGLDSLRFAIESYVIGIEEAVGEFSEDGYDAIVDRMLDTTIGECIGLNNTGMTPKDIYLFTFGKYDAEFDICEERQDKVLNAMKSLLRKWGRDYHGPKGHHRGEFIEMVDSGYLVRFKV